jgi:hypothetical protein
LPTDFADNTFQLVDNLDLDNLENNERPIDSELNFSRLSSKQFSNSYDTIIDEEEVPVIDLENSPITDKASSIQVDKDQTPRRPTGLLGSIDTGEDGIAKGRKYYNLIKCNLYY